MVVPDRQDNDHRTRDLRDEEERYKLTFMVFRYIYHHSHLVPLYLSPSPTRPFQITLPTTTQKHHKMKFILLSALSLLAVFATANPIDVDVGAVVSGAADAAASVGADVDAAVGDII
ncbi:hypothetical protein BDQ94DRAFT_174131 [Aspergillus welwitschiae]|uniref:Uncharacterized protein n=1 Tax=Aspergillus welwitschiae TaxID=1341132 RepID=A0A3F3PQ85_9EURO|nr:hypothetical protein BDQ94DRAFT_174131 [Aspergillus welwitschiae]RDH29097.1 hypothetical protein BDQ94DRAFT_174131 [Aspergillus welwitschiae]